MYTTRHDDVKIAANRGMWHLRNTVRRTAIVQRHLLNPDEMNGRDHSRLCVSMERVVS